MLIDMWTGIVQFDEPRIGLGPSTTRDEHLPPRVGAGGLESIENSWEFEARSGESRFSVSVYFEGDYIRRIILAVEDARFGTSWSDWSEEKELARKAYHDSVLSADLGDVRRFAWGQVWSDYEARDAASEIVIAYA